MSKQTRVIKFRALKDDMSNCTFQYGELVYDAIGQPRITHKDFSGKGLTFNTCIKGTEGQFTGLHDKNGEEIYEGDVLEFKNELGTHRKYNVFRVDGGLAINTHQSDFGKETPFYDACADMQTAQWIKQCTVIGNIHENPNLLS